MRIPHDIESTSHIREAPGRPGNPPRWSPGSKLAGGTARSDASLVWFTLGRGVLNEVYYPRIDSPCTRDLFLIVTGPDGFYSDERDDAQHEVMWLEDGVPGFRVSTTCKCGSYRIEKTFLTDDRLNVVLQHTRFTFLRQAHRVFAYINPHLAAHGSGNNAWIGRYKGQSALLAERGDLALALLSSSGFAKASAGFFGKSDGLDELKQHGQLRQCFTRAADGNVALIAEVNLADQSEFTLALGFGLGPAEAAYHATGGLKRNFAEAIELYAHRWRRWQAKLLALDDMAVGRNLYRKSTAILMLHTNKSIPGAVASLAIPWGDARGDDDLLQGAYHLVWSRDLVQHGGGLLAIGANNDARRVLEYLQNTQEPDGHWPQNMWVSGESFWDGIQVDQAAQPILFTDLALRAGAIGENHRERFWPMIRDAAGYILRNGASTELDRWEEEEGYSPYTLATMITALLATAQWSTEAGELELARYLRETADIWEACIDGWLYVRDTALAKQVGVDGYYARILPPGSIEPPYPGQNYARLIDFEASDQQVPAHESVSVDALALVRFGLRRPDDPKILNTLRVIDATLKLDMQPGPIWHRYTADQFGEHDNGQAFDTQNKGRGRAWPLLIGERAHYELAAGKTEKVDQLIVAMSNYAGDAGMISEQVWDMDDIPEKHLHRGRPSGSASPLLWAHSEYLKLLRSRRDGHIFDRPPQSERYTSNATGVACGLWRKEHPLRTLPEGMNLRIEAPTEVKLQCEIASAYRPSANRATESGEGIVKRGEFLGVQVVDIPAAALISGSKVEIRLTRSSMDNDEQHEVFTVEVIPNQN